MARGRGRGPRASDRGSALVATVTLVGTMMVLTLIYLRVGQRVSGEQQNLVNEMRAAGLAEAGINEAIEAIRADLSGNVGTAEAPAYLGGGVVWVEATDLGDGRTQLDAMAMKDSGRAALRVVVETGGAPGGGNPGSSGGNTFFSMLFSNKSLVLKQNVLIDSWDSELGTYASQAVNTTDGVTHAGTAGGAAGNGSIQLDANVHVFGNANPGPSYTVSQANTAYVSGTTTPIPEPVPLAQISVPFLLTNGIYGVANNATKTINPGTYHYTALTQGKFSTLKVIGPATIVLDSYLAGPSSTLEIDATNGPVTIYDTGLWLADKNYKLVPKAGTPIDGAFLISSPGTVQFKQGSELKFGFYAPNATIQVDQGAEVWGALVADQITVDQGTKFHFDENLRDYVLPWEVPASVLGIEEEESTEVLSWSTLGFPIPEYMRDRRSPFLLLGVESAQLLTPAEARADKE